MHSLNQDQKAISADIRLVEPAKRNECNKYDGMPECPCGMGPGSLGGRSKYRLPAVDRPPVWPGQVVPGGISWATVSIALPKLHKLGVVVGVYF